MIRVTYPNEGLYAGGQPRYEQVDQSGAITLSRLATPEEARGYALIDALAAQQFSMEVLTQQLRDLATYGITATVKK